MLRVLLSSRLRRPVLVIGSCLALFTGLFLARAVAFPLNIWWFCLAAAAAVICVRRHNLITLLFLTALFLLIGWWRGDVYARKLAVSSSFNMQKITAQGTAREDAVYGKNSQLEFSLTKVSVVSPRSAEFVGDLTIRGYGEPMVYRGDNIVVTGKLYPTLGNNLGSISYAEISVTERGGSVIDNLRRRFSAGMLSALPEPAASFVLGLLVGQRSTLPDEVEEQLRRVGLTHVIAVSGYNLTVIVMACRKLLAKRSKYQATASCFALLGVFLLITGSCPPIVRASVVSLLGIIAWYYGRRIKPMVLLLVSAAITVIANPLYLWGNVSWYLSFLAFYGVLVLSPLLARRLFNKELGLIGGVVMESICANVMVLPYILYTFGAVSLISLPVNVMIVPLVPLAMLLGLVAGLGGMLLPMIAGWLAWPAKLLTTFMLDITALFSNLDKAYIEDIIFSWRMMLASYAIIGTVMLVMWHRQRACPQVASERVQKNL